LELGFYELVFDRENDMENAEYMYMNLKFQLSFTDVLEMDELGGDHVTLSTCYILDTT
jgi:hypothetical protein